ncbi:LysE family translocator [uncultured Microbulbifer sp.]|uniref:LysE family translocator n=1 Tax=uncultured Microbulbifer sp. TaxID=348147 RepID=UPI0026200716|nr:LysE family translocator [uncultured Microbulbifer sp.]
MNIEAWLAFTAIASVATIVPGPAMLLVATHSLRFGILQSLKTILGNITGLAILSSISVAGLSALILYSSSAFLAVKIIGALYLTYLGIKIWRNGVSPIDLEESGSNQRGRFLYLQGIAVSLSNPKAIAFTTALFPQFIDLSEGVLFQFSILLGTFMALSFICLSACSIIAHKASRKVSKNLSLNLGKVFGGSLIGAGGLLLVSKHQ